MYVYVCMCVCMSVCLYVCACMHNICMHAYVCACVGVCVYVHYVCPCVGACRARCREGGVSSEPGQSGTSADVV